MDASKNDAGAPNIRVYFKQLLRTLLDEGEGFSGKRPFGNSGWEYELFAALVKAELVSGELDEDGYIVHFDEQGAYDQLFKAIDEI